MHVLIVVLKELLNYRILYVCVRGGLSGSLGAYGS